MSITLSTLLDPLNLRLGVFFCEILLTASLIFWIRRRQRGRKESLLFFISLVFWGMLTALLAGLIELKYAIDTDWLADHRPGLSTTALSWIQLANTAIASLIEELAKYMVGVFVILGSRRFGRLSDAILYMIIIGLGFSLAEDIIYLLDPLTIAPYRLLSFYIHSGTAAIIGYAMGRYKYNLGGYRELLWAVLGAISLHLAYNLSANLNNLRLAFWLTLAITVYISLQVFILYRQALEEEFRLDNKSKKSQHLLNL